jgi:hypothetical protein
MTESAAAMPLFGARGCIEALSRRFEKNIIHFSDKMLLLSSPFVSQGTFHE